MAFLVSGNNFFLNSQLIQSLAIRFSSAVFSGWPLLNRWSSAY